MQVAHLDEIEWFGQVGHRQGGVNFKRLLQGEEMTANNFEFNLAKVEESYTTPRHRHNFDQVRFVIDGSFGFSRDQKQTAGTIGYFSEGTYYQQMADGPSQTILLQCASASCAPYVSFAKLREAVATIKSDGLGEFNNGIFTSKDNGKKVNKDAFEAAWEQATAQTISYPRPRFDDPVIMQTDNFQYLDIVGVAGVQRKILGAFGERRLKIGFLRFDAGATMELDGRVAGAHLLYVLVGECEFNGQACRPGSAIHVTDDEATPILAKTPCELYYVRLPSRVTT
ncbi:MAG: hypothetical protein GXP16_15355 [Gammaproteobacteria bacterium]|nr:hypothetical protein [Gammaproteobacteria bacterium]